MKTTSLLLTIALAACINIGTAQDSSKSQSSDSSKSASGDQKQSSKRDSARDKALRVQILLDRANVSPGEIDGAWGKNGTRALNAFQQALGLPLTEEADESIIAQLEQISGTEYLRQYTITDQDVAGPYNPNIPTDLVEQSKLPQLAYRDILEMLGERFHCEPELIKKLNPEAKFAAGEMIQVPNVLEGTELVVEYPTEKGQGADDESPSEKKSDKREAGKEDASTTTAGSAKQTTAKTGMGKGKASLIVVSKSQQNLMAMDEENRLMLYAPVTSGSEHDPLPIGEWKVNGTDKMPSFNYNPELFWDANPQHTKAKIPSGPNNPVGVAWVDITKEHYGLHGTPEPGKIGYTQSHGCVRLTNWDAMRLATIAKPGVKVLFVE